MASLLMRESKTVKAGEEAVARLEEYARMSIDEVLARLGTDREGLTVEEAEGRLEEYGLNEVAHEKPAPWYVYLANAFIHPFNFILFLIIIVSYITDVLYSPPGERNWSTVIIVSVIIVASSLVTFLQEYKSVMEAERLRALVSTTAAVKRKGVGVREVRVEEIVPGDIVHLTAGDMIPADVRIIASKDFFVNQAVLTGESEPVEKYPELRRGRREGRLTIFDLDNIGFMGTSVVSGSAVGVVVATGENTYLGSMARRIMGVKALTGFERGVGEVSRLFIRFMIVMAPIVFAINWFTKGSWFDALLFALAVAVGLTPEMLPLVVSVSLAKGAVAMAKLKTIVKRLDAMQNFGAMDTLATDKTGTLTVGRVVLVEYMNVDGEPDDNVLKYAYLNSYFHTGLRNPLDMAILEYGSERGLNTDVEKTYRKVDEIPFDFTRRRVSVVLEHNGDSKKRMLVTKGAIKEMLAISTRVERRGEIYPLTEEEREKALSLANKLHEEGMRVLAVAKRMDVPPEEVFGAADERDLILVGFIAFLDPPKETAPHAVKALSEHGVAVKVITGDNEVIAGKVTARVGIPVRRILTGEEIDGMSDEELAEAAAEATVFARITPTQKARIIRALRRRGRVVGFLGDGVNDAPAMREADVSISVENAVDIAKESADVILLERSLTVLKDGIVKGREAFVNIIKYITITASSNFGNVFSVLVASAFLPFLPMTPVQILFLNMTYDFMMMLIPWDTVDEKYLKTPRKWDASNIKRFMVLFGPLSSIFDILTYALMYFVIGPMIVGAPYSSLTGTQKALFISLFQTGWFIESLWTQTMVVNMLRTEKIPFLQSRPSRILLAAMMTGLTVETLLPYTPLGSVLGFTPLPPIYFAIVLTPALLAYLTLAQIVKTLYTRRFGTLL